MDILIEIGWFAGWVLGIIGFFIARSARAELRLLRARPLSVAVPAPTPIANQVKPQPQAPATPPTAAKPSFDIEAVLTTNWGVWLGSAALLFAGIFLIRYAVEQELLGPTARCCLAALLGLILLAGAEWLHRHESPPLIGRFSTDQAPSGLAAGGTAILFGAAYGAGPFFDLLPPLLSFAAMALASLMALAAALRYGPLTAATGIAGAFITPALVATHNPSLPGLFAYLFLVSAAALWVVRQTAWIWLGWATTAAGAIWVCFAALPVSPDRWAAAVFAAAAAALNLGLLPGKALDHPVGRRLAWIPFAAMGGAELFLELIAPGQVPRAVLLLLSPIAIWKAISEPRLDRLPWLGALFGLLTLLIWPLSLRNQIMDSLFGPRTPETVLTLLTAGILFAAFHAVIGIWQERRAPNPLRWAALTAAVPVLTLAIAYARIAKFETGMTWGFAGLFLCAALTATSTAAARENDRQRAGVHAAGAVAALALAGGMMLRAYWLTLAIAMFLPPLAWIEAAAELPALRRVALVIAALVIVRLTLNWYVLGYDFGILGSGLVACYAIPAASFALAALLFRRRADDMLVATLDAGAVTFLALFIALEIRHATGTGHFEHEFRFTEVALHLLTIAIQATAYLYLAQRTGRIVLDWAGRILGCLALVYGAALLVLNPLLTGASAGVLTLAAGYLAPACLSVLAFRRVTDPPIRVALGAYAVAAMFVWITLQIRQVFHPGAMGFEDSTVEAAELWGWSGAWLAYGIALMFQGIRYSQRFLRLTALGVIGLVCAKVFAIDMSGLTGLWRVLSFLGLGLALIGLGVVYRRWVLPARQGQPG